MAKKSTAIGIKIGNDSVPGGATTISASEKGDVSIALNGFRYQSENKKNEFRFLDFSGGTKKKEAGNATLNMQLKVANATFQVFGDKNNSLSFKSGLVFTDLAHAKPPRLTFKLSGSFAHKVSLKQKLPPGTFASRKYSKDIYKSANFGKGTSGIPTSWRPKGYNKKFV